MGIQVLFFVLLVAPLLGFLFNGFRFRSKNYLLAGNVASGAALISFLCSVLLVLKLISLPVEERVLKVHFFQWLSLGQFEAQAAFLLDSISAIMVLVITGVGSLIHIFSVGYMSHDERPSKYFAYLNLFLFNMLLLVLGDNLLVMFVGWEGVGLCSYLLIGFWFKDKEKAAAGMKAFITNRIGDAGFLLGIFLIFATFGTVEFSRLISLLPGTPESFGFGPITLACLFLFIGATGKSAQIPLYVWLPDAMAGPTPVSALIHAATMVTAGVYMMIRLSHFFVLAPLAMVVIATVGAATALLAATIGLTQWDIKKILAYSTVSQLGYMVLAVGVGAFNAALFHLMTHAFFKALMFLGSGSVIHAMHEEQDVRKMGGLKKYLPITYVTFAIGWMAIIGLPPFAGFFSKDEILWYAFNFPYAGKVFWVVGVLGAMTTSFYMTRLMSLVFWGKSRIAKEVHPHESPSSMTVPLIVLAGLSVVGGWIGIPHILSRWIPGHPENFLEHWLSHSLAPISYSLSHSGILEGSLMGISLGLAGLSAWWAYDTYVLNPERPALWVNKMKPIYQLVSHKYYVDEFYVSKILNPLVDMSKGLWVYIDARFIDGGTYGLTHFVKSIANGFRSFQNGNLQQYALLIALGMISLMIFSL